jgi:hypothetical protein
LAGVEAASLQGKKRTAVACKQRYAQLCAAAQAAAPGVGGGKENLEAMLALLRQQLQQQLRGTAVGAKALAVVQALLARATADGGKAQQAALTALLQHHLQALLPGSAAAAALPAPGLQSPGASPAPLAQAQQVAAAVRQRCGGGAARVITGRLQHILEAGK